eukprot:3866486-Ditylum_brightwellii.AAC.1
MQQGICALVAANHFLGSMSHIASVKRSKGLMMRVGFGIKINNIELTLTPRPMTLEMPRL